MCYRPISDLHLEVERDFVRNMSKYFPDNSKDYMIYDTRVICNPRGYVPNINEGFNDSLLVKLK